MGDLGVEVVETFGEAHAPSVNPPGLLRLRHGAGRISEAISARFDTSLHGLELLADQCFEDVLIHLGQILDVETRLPGAV